MVKKEHIPERRKRMSGEMVDLKISAQIEALRQEISVNQAVVTEMKEDWDKFIEDFAEMLNIFRTGKSVFVFAGWFGKAIRWLALTGISIGAIWAGIKSGNWK